MSAPSFSLILMVISAASSPRRPVPSKCCRPRPIRNDSLGGQSTVTLLPPASSRTSSREISPPSSRWNLSSFRALEYLESGRMASSGSVIRSLMYSAESSRKPLSSTSFSSLRPTSSSSSSVSGMGTLSMCVYISEEDNSVSSLTTS